MNSLSGIPPGFRYIHTVSDAVSFGTGPDNCRNVRPTYDMAQVRDGYAAMLRIPSGDVYIVPSDVLPHAFDVYVAERVAAAQKRTTDPGK